MKTMFDVQRAFAAQKVNEVDRMKLLKIEKAMIDLGELMVDLCPENADRTAAFRLLLQAKWTFVQSVTHHQAPAPTNKEPQGAKKENQSK